MMYLILGLSVGLVVGFIRMYLWDKPKRNVAIISIFPTMVLCISLPLLFSLFTDDLLEIIGFNHGEIYMAVRIGMTFILSAVALYFAGVLYIKNLCKVFYDDPVYDNTDSGLKYVFMFGRIIVFSFAVIFLAFLKIPTPETMGLFILRFACCWLILIPLIVWVAYLIFKSRVNKMSGE